MGVSWAEGVSLDAKAQLSPVRPGADRSRRALAGAPAGACRWIGSPRSNHGREIGHSAGRLVVPSAIGCAHPYRHLGLDPGMGRSPAWS